MAAATARASARIAAFSDEEMEQISHRGTADRVNTHPCGRRADRWRPTILVGVCRALSSKNQHLPHAIRYRGTKTPA